MKKTRLLSITAIFLAIVSSVSAHSNVIYNISLDFDGDFKVSIFGAAKDYTGINSEPYRFDFDRELITVHFNNELDFYAEINPIDFSVSGFRNDSLIERASVVILSEAERKEIAESVFDSIPKEYSSELVYGGEKKLYSGIYKHTWYRFVNGVYIANEHLEVEVNPNSGDIVAWRLSVFSYPKELIKTIPAIDYQVAQSIAEIKFSAQRLDFNPILVVFKNEPVWIARVKSLYPIYIGIDALTGKVLFSGTPRAEIPQGYDYGREIPVIESDFIKKIYGSE